MKKFAFCLIVITLSIISPAFSYPDPNTEWKGTAPQGAWDDANNWLSGIPTLNILAILNHSDLPYIPANCRIAAGTIAEANDLWLGVDLTAAQLFVGGLLDINNMIKLGIEPNGRGGLIIEESGLVRTKRLDFGLGSGGIRLSGGKLNIVDPNGLDPNDFDDQNYPSNNIYLYEGGVVIWSGDHVEDFNNMISNRGLVNYSRWINILYFPDRDITVLVGGTLINQSDLNFDNAVNFLDLAILAEDWLEET